MPTSKQRRETARRRLERQLQRRQEQATRRRRRNLVTAAALGVVLVLGAVWLIIAKVGGNNKTNAAAATTPAATSKPATPTPTPSRPAKATSGACKYAESNRTLTNPSAKDVGLPPDPKATPNKGTVDFAMTTNLGTITIQLDRSTAPCTVQSYVYLASKKFFDNTKCHRLTTSGIFVLQCGDPSGTGSGGPTYQVKDENLSKATYKRGVVAMANAGPNTNGSQFFIIYKDSTSLPKNYTMIGKVTAGLDIVDKVAKAGPASASDGAPKLTVTIKTARIMQ